MTPIQPTKATNAVTVSATGAQPITISTAVKVAAAAHTVCLAEGDSGFKPTTLAATGPGTTVQFDEYGPGTHTVKENSPAALFASGALTAITYYPYTYAAAGTYTAGDADSANTATITVPDVLSATVVPWSPVVSLPVN